MTPTQADVDRWAALVARAYAEACSPALQAGDEVRLARALNTPIADCIMLGEGLSAETIDPVLVRWEAMVRRRPGPRLGQIDYGQDTVEMRA